MTDAPTRRPATVTELPLTPAQQRMWFVDRFHPGWPSHDELVYRLRGPIDLGVLEAALNLVLRRHEAVWARFVDRDGEPVQVLAGPGRLAVEEIRLDHLDPTERERRIRPLVAELRVAPFELSRGPLIRVTLVRLGPEEHVLCLVLHHIVSDGTSWVILLAELRQQYEALRDGRDLTLPDPPLDFGDYVLWQRSRQVDAEAHLGYWRERLADAPILTLPTDFPRPAERAGRGATVRCHLDRVVAEGVERVARAARCTPFMVLLAAYQVLLCRHSGQDDICVGSPTAGRTRPEFESIVGLFINMLVLRGDLAGDPTFRELLQRTRKRSLEAMSRQEIPYESIIEALDVPRDPSRTPLFQTVFSVHTQEGPSTDVLSGVTAEHFDDGDTYAVFDLVTDVWRTSQGLSVMVRFDKALFTAATAELLARQYGTLLGAVVDHLDVPISRLPLDDAEGAAELLALGRGPAGVGRDSGSSALAAFEAAAARWPEAIAVSAAASRVSYAAADRRANQLARVLRRRGLGVGSVVAICLPRSPDLVITALAIWKAGAAYLPLDPSYPPARLRHLLADSGATGLVTCTGLGPDGLTAASVQVICLDREAGAVAVEPTTGPDWPAARESELAYVIYTSGSSGTPKGVAVPQAAVAARVRWMRERYGLTPADRVLQFATVSFDTHVEEYYPCLTSGAELVLLPDDEQLPDFLAGPYATGLTVLDLPTPYWADLVAHPDLARWPATLRLMIIGADQARPASVAAWRSRVGDQVTLLNTYGPTEATVIATTATLGGADSDRRPPIGRPIAETTVQVVDDRLRPVPFGVAGELCVGGAGLARGYLGRPALTADRFRPDPDGPPGARRYLTGDRARWRADRQLEFLGRFDDQVKVRGYRVEPGEIEARLLAYPGVERAVVVPRGEADRLVLVGYLVGDGNLAPEAVRRQLAEELPEYLLPAAIVVLDRLPLTRNGKLDVAALPAPEVPPAAGPEHRAPGTDAEELVVSVWREVLGTGRISVVDDFFAIGGHSLLATRVAARLGAAIGVEVPIRTLFRHRTATALAAAVEELLLAELAKLSDEDAERILAGAAAAGNGPA